MRNTGDVQRVRHGALTVGAAVLGGMTALVVTAFVLALLHSSIIFSSCTTSSPPVCTPQSWKWVLSGAGVVGAAIGGIGALLVMRRPDSLGTTGLLRQSVRAF